MRISWLLFLANQIVCVCSLQCRLDPAMQNYLASQGTAPLIPAAYYSSHGEPLERVIPGRGSRRRLGSCNSIHLPPPQSRRHAHAIVQGTPSRTPCRRCTYAGDGDGADCRVHREQLVKMRGFAASCRRCCCPTPVSDGRGRWASVPLPTKGERPSQASVPPRTSAKGREQAPLPGPSPCHLQPLRLARLALVFKMRKRCLLLVDARCWPTCKALEPLVSSKAGH